MFVINNKVYYTPKEDAEMAYQRMVQQGYMVDRESFVAGYLAAIADSKE